MSACDGFCHEEVKDLQGEDAFIRTEEVLPKLFQAGLSRGRLSFCLMEDDFISEAHLWAGPKKHPLHHPEALPL